MLHGRLLKETKDYLERIIIPMETQLPPYTWDTNNYNNSRRLFRASQETLVNSKDPALLIHPIDDIADVMAMTHAYMEVSSKRFVDTVPQLVDLMFLHGLTKELRKMLVEQLGLVDPKENVDLDGLMVEDKHIRNDRDRLLAKQECLEKSLEELERFND